MNPAISSFVPPVAPQMPPQGGAPSSSSSQTGFSEMLSQAQARETEAPAAEATPEASEPVRTNACNNGCTNARTTSRTAERGKGEKADKGHKADGECRAEMAESEAQPVDAGTLTEATHDTPVADPTLTGWLAALQRPAAPQDAVAPKAAAPEAEAGMDPALSLTGSPSRAALGAAAGSLKTQDAAAQAREIAARPEPEPAQREPAEAEPSTFQAAMAQADDGRRELKPVPELPSTHGTAPAGVQPAQGASRTSEAAVPVAVQVPTPATSPEFAQSLGVQVSVLAKDGIQHAELHLNPAEMGPISVQIAIEGTQAQVNFGADSAATRQIIESGLPELAASLREAGFTLAGGGVHSQARGREQGGDPNGERGGPSGARAMGGTETDVTPRRMVSRVSAGGVDLYA